MYLLKENYGPTEIENKINKVYKPDITIGTDNEFIYKYLSLIYKNVLLGKNEGYDIYIGEEENSDKKCYYLNVMSSIKRKYGCEDLFYKKLRLNEEYKSIIVESFDLKWVMGDLISDYPICPYFDRDGSMIPSNIKTNFKTPKLLSNHWGQRKLLLSEIDLLNHISNSKKYIIVYAGAADGRHISLLPSLFPNIELHLYDPAPFYENLKYNKNILINKFYKDNNISTTFKEYGFFTDEVANYYSHINNVIFVSDIRVNPSEKQIEIDQRNQERWVRIINPEWSLLKYKLPYPSFDVDGKLINKTYKHMAGHIRFQCWPDVLSAETRLLTNKEHINKDVEYDVRRFELNLSWYNNVARHQVFNDVKLKDIGIDCNGLVKEVYKGIVKDDYKLTFDFCYELQILSDYLYKMEKEINVYNLRDLILLCNTVLIDKNRNFESYLSKVKYVNRKK